MPKSRRSLTTRKPPVPSESHAEIEEWMRHLVPDMQPIVERVDRSIRQAIPGVRFAVKWKQAYYGRAELGWTIEMAAYVVSVNVVFLGGEDFDPQPPLGDTDRSRYVKVHTVEEAETPELRSWIEQAGRVTGWGANAGAGVW